jgi:hypothetical protein
MVQFVVPIREGRKNHTIRANRKYPIKPGDKLYLYCGRRRKGAFRILPDPVTCTRAFPIQIHLGHPGVSVTVDGQQLSDDEREALATADGFESWTAMALFWVDNHSRKGTFGLVRFNGQIIHWSPRTMGCGEENSATEGQAR